MTFNEFRNYFGEQIHDFYYFEKDECGHSWLRYFVDDWTEYELYCYLRFKNDRSMFDHHRRHDQEKISVNGVPLEEYFFFK